MNKKLFNYIANSPTAYQACAHTADILKQSGFNEIRENEKWVLEENKGYFVKRNGSSLIAFKIPAGGFKGFMIAAAHSDSPCLKIKENAEMTDKYYVRLSTETYGGMIYSSWLDRPLAVAGRVCVKGEKGIEIRLVDTKEPVALIPNVAIHMNRSVNSGMNYNASVDLIPLFGGESEKDSFKGIKRLNLLTAMKPPKSLLELRYRPLRFKTVVDNDLDKMSDLILRFADGEIVPVPDEK